MAFMAPVMGMLGGASGIASTLGTVLSLAGAVSSARGMKAAARAEQQQLNIKAGQEEAVSQKRAALARDKANLMMSRAMAVGAASGAGTSGIEGIMSGLAERGDEAAQGEIYEGSERANTLRYQGEVGVADAKQKASATLIGAFGNAALKGVGGIAGKYADGPAPTLDYGYSEGSGTGYTSRIW